jgi:hypothetical protein
MMTFSPPNPRLQRTRSASPPSPLSRQPLGRPSLTRLLAVACLTAAILFLRASSLLAQNTTDCSGQIHSFAETQGKVIFVSGSPLELRRPLAVAVMVLDSQGQCGVIKKALVAMLSKAFPSWHFVADKEMADLQIVYLSATSICLDDCDPTPLPQAASVELVMDASGVQALWSDSTRWRTRTRLAALFVGALAKVVNDKAA